MPTNRSIDALFTECRIALSNGRNDADLQAVLAPFGYDDDGIGEGITLLEEASRHVQQQEKEYAEQYAATDRVHEASAAARAAYMRHIKLARIAFRDDQEAFDVLGLDGRRDDTVDGWIPRAQRFYRKLLNDPALLETMTSFTVDQAVAEAGLASLDDVETALAEQTLETSEAQAATRLRDDAVARLRGFMTDYLGVARIATEGHPQLREKLGLLER